MRADLPPSTKKARRILLVVHSFSPSSVRVGLWIGRLDTAGAHPAPAASIATKRAATKAGTGRCVRTTIILFFFILFSQNSISPTTDETATDLVPGVIGLVRPGHVPFPTRRHESREPCAPSNLIVLSRGRAPVHANAPSSTVGRSHASPDMPLHATPAHSHHPSPSKGPGHSLRANTSRPSRLPSPVRARCVSLQNCESSRCLSG